METQRSQYRLRTEIDSDPHNRYTTAPLVINHANAIDLTQKAFLQANREHKQERDKHNLKLQINMRLMKTRRSSSLFERTNHHRRTRSRTGALVHSKQPWRHSCSKIMSVSRGNQELNKTQTLRRVTAANYRVLGVTPLDVPPNGPKHDTRSNGPKDGVAAPWQILDPDLF